MLSDHFDETGGGKELCIGRPRVIQDCLRSRTKSVKVRNMGNPHKSIDDAVVDVSVPCSELCTQSFGQRLAVSVQPERVPGGPVHAENSQSILNDSHTL